MNWLRGMLMGAVLALVAGSAVAADEAPVKKEVKDESVKLTLAQVPEKVLAAALKAVPGIKLTEAEAKPTKDGIPFKARIASVAEAGRLKERLDEAWQSLKAGLVRAVSIGFAVGEYATMKSGGMSTAAAAFPSGSRFRAFPSTRRSKKSL